MRKLLVVGIVTVFSLSNSAQCYSPNIVGQVNKKLDIVKEIDDTEYESRVLAKKLSKVKETFYLEYKNEDDLLETCKIIVEETKESNFSKYDIATIIIKESRFDKRAYNKRDGGKGYVQITGLHKGWHDDVVSRNINPFKKRDAIIFAVKRLEKNLDKFGSKKKAIERYNGNCYASRVYVKDFYRIKNMIKTQKIS